MEPKVDGVRNDYGFNPPPYNAGYGSARPYQIGYEAQVEAGKSGLAVVYPPGGYDNTAYPQGQAPYGGVQSPDSPPEYRVEEEEEEGEEENCFSDAGVRRGFIRKVYLTLMIQLLVTVGIICAFLYWDALRQFTLSTYWFSFCMMAVVLVMIFVFSCCVGIRRRVPLNFIALGLFTIAEGMMLGSLTVYYAAEAVLWAMGATALVSFSLSVFAMQSKWDFTAARGSLWAFGWTLVSFGLLCAILRSQYLYIMYACIGTLLFSIYLVVDTQQMVGGKNRKYSISPEEYIFAALNLYLDIITLFLLLLQLIGLSR
ncbi:protein lifeguard 1 [Gadus macrocephalus]|uniref:protein lifeguard 1 n=1 Tax=Gadus macrocephalus TaxID=80720 RepID=UPI0028CB3863|nr:protein lifeguard 1 [Gadus macrocephalus]